MTLRVSQVPLSTAGIANLECVSVANIDSPTELNSIAGTVVGERKVAYQAVAGDNVYTIYCYDSSDTSGASSPYVMAASGSGFWIAIAGKYTNSAHLAKGAITSSSTVTGTQLISNIATGTAPLLVTSTTVVPNLNVSQLLGATWAAPGSIGSTTPGTGAFTTLTANGATTFTATTASTSSSTGAVVIGNGTGGGLGVGGSIFGGGDVRLSGTGAFKIFNATSGDTWSLNASQFACSLTQIGVNDWLVVSRSTGIVTVNSTTASTSTTTGALVVSGGLGVGGDLYVGATGNFTGSLTCGVLAATSTGANTITISDSATNTAPSVIQARHLTSGTPAAGFGSSIDAVLHSSTNTPRVASQTITSWATATDASRAAQMQFYVLDTGFRLCLSLQASGTAPMVGLYSATPVIQYATTGTATGFTAGAGTTVTHLSTFTGNTGTTAYTMGDVVRALKLIGAMAA